MSPIIVVAWTLIDADPGRSPNHACLLTIPGVAEFTRIQAVTITPELWRVRLRRELPRFVVAPPLRGAGGGRTLQMCDHLIDWHHVSQIDIDIQQVYFVE